MMRLVTYGITDVSANLTSIPPTHHPGLLWGSADFEVSTAPRDGRFIITWTFPDDEKRVSKVEVKAIPGRRVRHRGWERLRIHGDEHEFRAYRVFVLPNLS